MPYTPLRFKESCDLHDIVPSFSTSFLCECGLHEVISKVAKAAVNPHNDLKIVEASYDGTQTIVLVPHVSMFEYTNSYRPITTFVLREESGGTRVSVSFELREFVGMVVTLCLAAAFILAVMAVALLIVGKVELLLPVLLAFGMTLLTYVSSIFGLFSSSRDVLVAIFEYKT